MLEGGVVYRTIQTDWHADDHIIKEKICLFMYELKSSSSHFCVLKSLNQKQKGFIAHNTLHDPHPPWRSSSMISMSDFAS